MSQKDWTHERREKSEGSEVSSGSGHKQVGTWKNAQARRFVSIGKGAKVHAGNGYGDNMG